jgi:hypothetical protein
MFRRVAAGHDTIKRDRARERKGNRLRSLILLLGSADA